MKNGFTLIELVIFVGFIVSIAVIFGLVYAAIHFILKFW